MGGGHGHEEVEPRMVATVAEMDAARIDPQWRDYCAHLLIPLNECRTKNFSLPFRCVDERHAYEKCQYDHYQRRVKEMSALIKEARNAKQDS